LVHRAANEYRPAADGSIFVIAERKRDIALPVIRSARARALAPWKPIASLWGAVPVLASARVLYN
jgi:hypothetical protein